MALKAASGHGMGRLGEACEGLGRFRSMMQSSAARRTLRADRSDRLALRTIALRTSFADHSFADHSFAD